MHVRPHATQCMAVSARMGMGIGIGGGCCFFCFSQVLGTLSRGELDMGRETERIPFKEHVDFMQNWTHMYMYRVDGITRMQMCRQI